MLGHKAWINHPDFGYLQSFDVIVHVGGADFVPELTRIIRDKQAPAVGYAAYLSLDRLVQLNPALVLEKLGEDSALLAGREGLRADLFARADVRDPRQRRIVEDYLLRIASRPNEAHAFLSGFPNANFIQTYNLLTKWSPRTPSEQKALDHASLALLQKWAEDSRFVDFRVQIQQARARLVGVVRPLVD